MFEFAVHSSSLFKPIMLQLRFVGACFVLGLFGYSFLGMILDAFSRAKVMHQIPCTKCRFFTGDYRLKCTVNPHAANTEKAIDCPDFNRQA